MAKKITETGPVGLKGVRNSDLYGVLGQLAQNGDSDALNILNADNWKPSRPATTGNTDAYFTPQQYEQKTAYSSLGNSRYDNPYILGGDETDVNEIRYENQPWYDTLANGAVKMLGTAGTTFLSSLIGIPVGIGTAVSEGRWSGLWDNSLQKAFSDTDKWFEDNFTNYKSEEQQNSPWYSPTNLLSMNFWADDVIKNVGFTLGAAASMAVGSGSLGLISRAFGAVNEASKGAGMAGKFASALFSATGEGMIEARNGVEERNKLETQRLNDALAPERQALEEEFNLINEEYNATKGQTLITGADGRAYDPAYLRYNQRMQELGAKRNDLNQRYEAGLQQIEESGREMGNKILLGNQALLTAGNLIQFGKMMNKSFDNARHAAEITSKSTKPFGVAAKRVSDSIKDGYKVVGKEFGRALVAPKNLLKEGMEEMNQQWIQNSAGAAYNEKDVNDYWRARLDPDSYRETTQDLYSLGNTISQGFKESWGDVNQWEQFFVGAITGLSGSYAPTKIFNQDQTKSRLNPMRYGEWSGSAIQDVRDFNREYNQYEENINDLNKILAQENFGERTRSLVAHTYLERQKDDAALKGDMKMWKDEDDKQAIQDIQAFLRAGKIDDLRAIYEEMGKNMSDEDIQGIIKATTQEISAEKDKQNHDDAIDAKIAEHRAKIDNLNEQANKIAEDAGLLESSDEITAYNNSVQPAIEKLYEDVDKEYAAIDELERQKQSYAGQTRYVSPYLNEDGSQRKSNDEIREEIKHNSEAMNRKLNSYLDSVEEVNRRTGGNLTKDQEDNLAYLHNMGRSSIRRADDIVEGIRQDLPAKFLFKTDKTPEQLAKEYASSDLAFTKDDDTPEGYVNVDASMLAGHNFTDFLIRDIIWGGNQRSEFGETADERAAREEEEKNLDEEERNKRKTAREKKKYDEAKKNAQEQNLTNWQLMIDTFADNYKKRNRATETETDEATGEFIGNIVDALRLMQQAGGFEKTLNDYMRNPQKVDEAKAKEEKKADAKNKKDRVREKLVGKTPSEINQGIQDGDIGADDIAALYEVDDDDPEIAAAKEATENADNVEKKKASLKGKVQDQLGNEEFELAGDDIFNKVEDAIDRVAANADSDVELNYDTIIGEITTDSPEEADVVGDLLAAAFEAHQADEDKKDDIPDVFPETNEDSEDTGHDSTTKMPAETAVPKVEATQNNDEWEQPIPTSTLNSTAVSKVEEEVNKEDSSTYQSAPWRSTTRRYGRQRISGNRWGTARVPYHELPDAKNPKRSEAIWTYLKDNGAWDNVDNAEADKIVADKTTIHFMVRDFTKEIFGEETRFEDLTEEQKPEALVILMLDDRGKVLGDLPLAQYEKGYNDDTSLIKSPQLKELKATQEKLFKAFEEKRKKTGCIQAIADGKLHRDGAENLNLTFGSSRKPLLSKISQILNGIVPFGNEINTLNDIMGSKDLLLGISVTGETIATSRDKKDRRGGAARPIRVANVGQSYILIPSPSGALMPVPFYTKPFDAKSHADTQLYRILGEALTNLVNNAGKSDTSTYKESMDVLEGLLQVRAQEGAKTTVEVTKDNVTLHLQSLTNPDQHIDIKVVNTGNAKDAAKEFLNYLSGTPINISLQFINSKIGVKNGTSAPYNRVIGEIADANLPKDTTHTVNNAFLIKLTTDAGTQRTEVRYQQSGTQTFNVGDKTVKVDIDKFTAYQIDPTTKEETLIEGDEEVNNLLAEIKASQQADKTKPFKIELDGQIRTYDPVKKEFIRTSQGSGVNAGEASINQQKEDRKNGNAGEASSTKTTTQREATVEQQPAEHRDGDITSETSTKNGVTKTVYTQYRKTKSGAVKPIAGKGGLLIDASSISEKSLEGAEHYEEIRLLELRELGDGNIAGTIWAKDADGWEKYEVKFTKDPRTSNETISQPVERRAKTIEEIEKEVGEAGIINKRNKDAWDAISDSLKLKMVNEGTGIVLEYGGNEVTLDYRDFEQMKNALKEANKYAKSGSMTAREGAKYRRVTTEQKRKANIRREKEWLQKNLPMFSTEERLHLIQGLLEIPGEKNWAWGRFEKGIITLSDRAARGTLYHEAFHAVTQTLLSDDELNALYDAAVKHYKETDVAYVEELLAEDFRRYVQMEETPVLGPIRRFFRKIMNAIRNLSGYRAPIQELFYRINNGEFSESIPMETRNGNAFYSRVRKDRLLPEDHPMHIAIEKAFNKLNWDGNKGKQWTSFKNAWIAEGYTPVAEPHYLENGAGLGYHFVGVRTNADEEISKRERARNNRARREAERHQAEQSTRGVSTRLEWDRLPAETQMRLMDEGIHRDNYENMSIGEQGQYKECRG